MADYVSRYTGAQIDEAVGKALAGTTGGSATVTADSIKTALGYTPADKTVTDTLTTKVATLENKVANGITDEDKAAIALQVLDMIEDSTAQVVVDDSKNITLSGDLADGDYTLKYLNSDGSTTTIATLTISGGTGEGSGGTGGGTEEPEEPDDPVVTPTGNLFVASTCTLNKRINSSGEERDQNYTFLTDYIDIGDCLAQGGTNQIHFRDFWVYQMTADDVNSTGNNNLASSAYRTLTYYDASGNFVGQDTDFQAKAAVTDSNGDYVITLNSAHTTATKIRLVGTLNTELTSTDQLANCKITLNELITD